MTNIDLKKLNEQEKKAVLEILKEYSDTGKSSSLYNILYED